MSTKIANHVGVVRNPKRASYDSQSLFAVVDEGYVAHVAVTSASGRPRCIPMAYVRIDDQLYIHGARKSALMQGVVNSEVCIAITHLDGLVLARSAFHHSMNYRSAVIFGRGRRVDDSVERTRVFAAFVERMAKGRSRQVRMTSEKEDRATAVVAIELSSAAVKIRTGDPIDDPTDLAQPCWAGVIPLAQNRDEALPAANYQGTSLAPTAKR